jgi:hypothetical protein
MVIKTRNGRSTQLWYFDQRSKTIKTKLNNQSFDIENNGRSLNMRIWSTNSQWFQIFVYSDEHFCNIENKKCLDVTGSQDNEG